MNKINWNGCSCCGSFRKGIVEYEDGEILHVTEFINNNLCTVISYKNDQIFTESARIKDGQQVLVDAKILDNL